MRRHEARDTGDRLVSAGFKANPADTPERSQQLRAMPPLKIVSQPKGESIIYRYADPYSCDCLYVGDQQAYAEYQRSRAAEADRLRALRARGGRGQGAVGTMVE